MTLAVSIAQSGANNVTMRNRIINGNMVIDQRNNGAVVSSAIADDAFYTLDRWYGRQNAASKFSIQRSTVAPAGFSNSILLTSLSAYSLGASEHFGLTQPIEGFNTTDFAWGTANGISVTLSFWVRSSLTGTFGGHVNNADSTMTYVFSYTINSANTWEYKTITIPAPTTSTWQTGNLVGLYLTFSIGAGSSVTRSTGWGAFARSVTGQTSLVGTNGATFYATGVQVEEGTTATAFEQRLYGQELALCQRYYYKNQASGGADYFGSGQAYSTTSAIVCTPFAVPMRTNPTALEQNGQPTHYRLLNSSGSGVNGSSVPVFNTSSAFMASTVFTVASGLTAGNGTLAFSGNAAAYLAWSAEL